MKWGDFVAGKTIQLNFIDNKINGKIKARINSWTTMAFKIPRNELATCNIVEELSYVGVYFLFGKSKNSKKPSVYIGQAGPRKAKGGTGILMRFKEHEHDKLKSFWYEAVAITSANNTFDSTAISYLEHRFVKLAKQANRYNVENSNDPTPGNITDERTNELDEII